MEATESVSTSGNKSKGEDMDACLEEVNKDSKVWQHGSMAAWLLFTGSEFSEIWEICARFVYLFYLYVQVPGKKRCHLCLTGEVHFWTCVFVLHDSISTCVAWYVTVIL